LRRWLTDAVIQGGLSYPWIALRPVITAARNQPHPVAVTLDAETETIVLDFVQPLWTSRDLAIGQAQAGTTPFSPMSARRRTPTLLRRAAGARFRGTS